MNKDMCKFESLQKDKSRAYFDLADSSKAYRKLRAFNIVVENVVHF